jgi:UDP-N-acetylglucosamine 2-epimerase (non-hydrolysing)
MAKRKRYAVVLGTRPEFIKLAAFLLRAPQLGIDLFTIHTGQHFDENMSGIFFAELGLPHPDATLDKPTGQSSATLGTMIAGITEVLRRERDSLDGVIVLGDTFSTLAGSLAASRVHLPLVHIEAGLRSNDRRMPEELNRIVIDNISDMLFTTEQSGMDNLSREGIAADKVFFAGNIGIESLELTRPLIEGRSIRADLGLEGKRYYVATLHRQEHTHDPEILERLVRFLSTRAEHTPIVFPLHPATRAKLERYGLIDALRVQTIEPLGYLDFMNLVMGSVGVMTDSGGIQEESAHLGIPCCTLRDNTERPITIDHGSNKLFPPTTLNDDSHAEVEAHLARTDFASGRIPLWDTQVSERIIRHLI